MQNFQEWLVNKDSTEFQENLEAVLVRLIEANVDPKNAFLMENAALMDDPVLENWFRKTFGKLKYPFVLDPNQPDAEALAQQRQARLARQGQQNAQDRTNFLQNMQVGSRPDSGTVLGNLGKVHAKKDELLKDFAKALSAEVKSGVKALGEKMEIFSKSRHPSLYNVQYKLASRMYDELARATLAIVKKYSNPRYVPAGSINRQFI